MGQSKPAWHTSPLGKLAKIKSGFAFKSSQWQPTGVPVVKIGNVKSGSLDMAGCSYVSEQDATDSGFDLKRDDIVIGLTGYVGQVAKVRGEGRLVLNQRVGKFYIRDGCDPDFLYALVTDRSFRERVEAIAHGSAQPNVSPSAIEQLEIFAPQSVAEQRKIATVLSTLDEQIELNRRMNETLEASARALFRDWFVDFGPTRAKAEGRPAYLAPDLWSLFPDRLDDDGVPEGWKTESLLDQAHWVNGAAYKNMHFVDQSEGLPVVKIAELKAGVTGQTKFTSTDLGERYRISDGELLFSWSGNPDTSIDAFLWAGGPAWLNQHIFAVRENGKRSKGELFVLLKWLMPEFAEIARNKQTTGLGHVTKDDMKRLRVGSPPGDIQTAFAGCITPIFDQILGNISEFRTLAETRDALLPKLMSGEIRVRAREGAALMCS